MIHFFRERTRDIHHDVHKLPPGTFLCMLDIEACRRGEMAQASCFIEDRRRREVGFVSRSLSVLKMMVADPSMSSADAERIRDTGAH